jgi:hypoxanthine phosphoribosyltransferase
MEIIEGINLRLLYPENRISTEVQRLADDISADYAGQELLLVVVLKGAFIFAADLARRIRLPLSLDFIRISSYSGMETRGQVFLADDFEMSVENKHVLIVEDILDTGVSLDFLLQRLRRSGPKSIKVCTLIDKQGRRRSGVTADYTGMVCDSGFLVGYGLDLDERCRELPSIYEVVANPSCGGPNDSPM